MSVRTREQLSSQEASPEPKQRKMDDEEAPTIELLYKILKQVQANTDSLLNDNKLMREEVTGLTRKLNAETQRVDALIAENKKLASHVMKQDSEIASLKASVMQTNTKLEEVESRQDTLEQYNRKHNLLIYGIPERPDEDLTETIKELGDLVDVEIISEEIDIVHRLNSKSSPRPIIVKFVQYSAKKELYEARRKLKRVDRERIETTNCLYGAKKIYINENLTAQRSSLFSEVRKRVRQYDWFASWTLDGKIFLRMAKGGRVYRIDKQMDLEALYG